ncbi:hypothetical protein C2U68_20270 [Methylomonas koyamae]|nr:hypothetical protein C2U68_20270 [Methylomonas koyamae]
MIFYPLKSRYGTESPPCQKIVETIKTNPVIKGGQITPYISKETISPFSNDDVLKLFRQLEENAPPSFTDYIRRSKNSLEIVDANEELELFLQDHFYSTWYYDKAFLLVNLHATDEHIMEDFKNWLIKTRESSSKKSAKKAFTEIDFKEWTEYKILPFIDLKIWGEISGHRLTNSVVGNLLFPEEPEIDTTERIRRTTKPKAERLLNSSIIDAFGVQVRKDLN